MADPLDKREKSDIIEVVKPSRDATLTLCLSEEKLLKRCRQVSDGMFTIIVQNGIPTILVINGKLEILSH